MNSGRQSLGATKSLSESTATEKARWSTGIASGGGWPDLHTSAFRLIVDGQGRVGFVKGNSLVALRDDGASTAVDVSASVEVGGAVARVGQRLLGSVSKMMMDRFFACLLAKVAAATGAP